MKILDHWRRELQRGWNKPDPLAGQPLMKRNRIELQFRRLEADCEAGFRAGLWLQWTILKTAPHPWFDDFKRGVSALASKRYDQYGVSPSNQLRDWSKRKPVAHLCLASGNAIGRSLAGRDLRGFGLSDAILNSTWVAEAILEAENWARTIPGQISLEESIRFHRDTF